LQEHLMGMPLSNRIASYTSCISEDLEHESIFYLERRLVIL